MLKNIFKYAFLYLGLFIGISAYANPAALLLRESSDPVGGNPKGKVTIVEFFDYRCSYCVSMSSTLNDVLRYNPDVRVVYKEFPIRGEVSEFAARAALAANKQGKYYAFHQALMSNASHLNQETILVLAKQIGLDVEQLQKDMTTTGITNQLLDIRKLADTLNVSVTPSFYIGKTNASDVDTLDFELGSMSKSSLQKLINTVRK